MDTGGCQSKVIVSRPTQIQPVTTQTDTARHYCPVCGGLECMERPRYFAGQLLTETELTSAQEYVLAKNRLHNRYLHGWGVVCGLEVVCHECAGWVTVRSGYAIDPCGNDIIVCKDQGLNFIKLVRDCQDQGRGRSECDPVDYYGDAACEDAEQTWCLAIVYDEKEARLITALPGDKKSSCRCGCNGNGKQNHCDCGCHTTKKTTEATRTVSSSSSVMLGQCEPTRIVEGYHFCAILEDGAWSDCGDRMGESKTKHQVETEDWLKRELGGTRRPEPGTLAYQLQCCCQAVTRLQALAPDRKALADMTSERAHQACCDYRTAVQKFFKNTTLTNCQLLDDLAGIQCPSTAALDKAGNLEAVVQAVEDLNKLLLTYLVDCFCLAVLPKCPPPPQDNRVVLACITFKGDQILRICNYTGRHQVVTFPNIEYWLSFSPVWATVQSLLEALCCGDHVLMSGLLGYAREKEAKYANLSSVAGLYRLFAEYLDRMIGRCLRQPAAEGEMRISLNSDVFIGRKLSNVERELKDAGITYSRRSAENLPPQAIRAFHLVAPAAVTPGDHLILHTKNDVVIGVEAQNEVQRLQNEVNSLREEVATLKRQPPAQPVAKSRTRKR